jgi:hypothetical protein
MLVAFDRHHVDAATVSVELYGAFGESEERVIAALAHILARMELGAALANENVASDDVLAAKTLHAATLRIRVATVAARTLTLLMCHDDILTAKLTADESQNIGQFIRFIKAAGTARREVDGRGIRRFFGENLLPWRNFRH